ncbi:MAG: hypothetical protein ACRDKJ_00235, partial [Actinomycetota bacterium]
ERAADLCREMAYQYLWLGRFDDVLAANQRGLDILGDRRVASRAYHLAGMGALLGVGGFFEAAREHIAQGEEIALEIKDDRALGWVNWTRCVVAYSSTLLEETIEAGETATAQLRRGGDTWTVCDSLSWTALALVLGGSTDKARSVCTEALELSRRLGHRGGEILAHRAWLATEAIRDLDLGRWEQGVRRDIELCESINSPWSSQGYAWLGAVVQMQGRTDEALGYLETALEIEPVSAFSGLSRAYTVLNHAYAGNREAFVSAADAVRPSRPGGPEAQPWGSKILTFNIAQGSAFLELEQVAAEIHEHVIAAGNVIPLGFFDGALARRIAGMTATLLRRWDEAEAHFMAARQQAIDYKTSVEPHQVEHWYGKMLLDRGRPDDRERATEMVGSALEWYRAKSMPLHAAMAEELLKKTV